MAEQKELPRKTVRIPLVGLTYSRGLLSLHASDFQVKDQFFHNVFYTKYTNPITQKEVLFCEKRPGLTNSLSLGTDVEPDECMTATVWMGRNATKPPRLSIWLDNTTPTTKFRLKDEAGGPTEITMSAQPLNFSRITECQTGGNQCAVFWVGENTNGAKGYIYNESALTTLTEITDADFTTYTTRICGNFVFLDGYLFFMTRDGRIVNSDLNSLTAWTSTSFISTQSSMDQGVGLFLYKGYIGAFNTTTTEFFEDVGNATGSPLRLLSNLTINIGCWSQSLSTNLNLGPVGYIEGHDTVFWHGRDLSGTSGIYMLDNFKAVKISDASLDDYIAQANYSVRMIGCCYLKGHPCLLLSIGDTTNVDTSLVLMQLDLKLWSFWEFDNIPNAKVKAVTQSNQSYGFPEFYGDTRIWTFGERPPIYQDANVSGSGGISYPVTMQTSLIDFGTSKYKRLHKFRLIGNEEASTTNVSVQWTNDDYQTFTTARTIDMSATNPYLNACGIFRRRAFKISYTGANPLRLEALEFEYSEMLH